jgi:hypothetical protein
MSLVAFLSYTSKDNNFNAIAESVPNASGVSSVTHFAAAVTLFVSSSKSAGNGGI